MAKFRHYIPMKGYQCRTDKMSTGKMSNRKIGEKEENGERTVCRNLKIQK